MVAYAEITPIFGANNDFKTLKQINMKQLIIFLAVLTTWYLLFSLIIFNLNASQWHWTARLLCTLGILATNHSWQSKSK
jgi:hypothetical protein